MKDKHENQDAQEKWLRDRFRSLKHAETTDLTAYTIWNKYQEQIKIKLAQSSGKYLGWTLLADLFSLIFICTLAWMTYTFNGWSGYGTVLLGIAMLIYFSIHSLLTRISRF